MPAKHPQIITARLLIEVGSVKSFKEIFPKAHLSRSALAEATGKSIYRVKKWIDHPSSIRANDLTVIAEALEVKPKIIRDLVAVDLGKIRPQP